ncbi:hypothetical protein [Limnospira sp. PMC 289.06]|uniref:hypothetical protein n=1 Tax=Limnospira sp. PMC 289.06 TaxID=2981094 RepID=UPI0028E1167B|nr:hypothetical protein [Limnospira sp. PMC 289.06]
MRTKTHRKPGNPNFSTDKNPAILRQEGENPAKALFAIRVTEEVRDKLAVIPNSELRKLLTDFANNYPK